MLFFPADSCVILQLQLFGQLLPQQGWTVRFWMLPPGSGDQFCDPLSALLSRWLISSVYSLRAQCWEFSSLPHPLSLRHVQCPTLSVFNYSSLFVFQFCRAVPFWMVLSGSGDPLCDPLPALLWGVSYCLPALSLHCLSCVYLLRVWHWEFSSLPSLLSLGQVQCSILHSAVCAKLQFAVCFSVFFGGDQTAQGLSWFMFPEDG
jgi:hypothetical protein